MTFQLPDLPVYPGTHWTADALCAQTDPEAFYPQMGDNAHTAAKICRSCPVRQQCLDATLAFEETTAGRPFGYAGGMSAVARQRILEDRRPTTRQCASPDCGELIPTVTTKRYCGPCAEERHRQLNRKRAAA